VAITFIDDGDDGEVNINERKITFFDEDAGEELTSTDNIESSPINLEGAEVDDPFTNTEKFISGSAPVVSGIAGSIAGASLGTAIAPGLGTLIGAAAGGAISSGAGRFLGDSLQDFFGGEEFSGKEKLKRAALESSFSIVADTATFGAGKLLKGPILKGVKSLAKKHQVFSTIPKKLALSKKVVQSELDGLGRSINSAKLKLAEAFKKLPPAASPSTAPLEGAINKLTTIVDSESAIAAKKIANASNKSLKTIGLGYDSIEKEFGKRSIDLSNDINGLSRLVDSTDPIIFQSMKPIENILKKLDVNKPITVKNSIALNRALKSQVRKLYNRGGEASGALAENLSDTVNGISLKLNQVTDGATSALDKQYREAINLTKSNSLFRDDLLKAGNAGLQNVEDILQADIKTLVKNAETSGSKFFKVNPKNALKAIQSGESVFDIGSKQTLKLINQSKILRNTGIDELVGLADEIDSSLIKVTTSAIERSKIKKDLIAVGVNKDEAIKLSEFVEKSLKSTPDYAKLLSRKSVLESRKGSIKKAEGKVAKIALDLGQGGFLDPSKDMLGLFIAGNSAGAVLTSVGLGQAGIPVMAAINLAGLAKWSPQVANTLTPIVKQFSEGALSTGVKSEAAKQILQDLSFSTLFPKEIDKEDSPDNQ